MTAPRKLGQWIETDTSDVRANLLWERVNATTKPARFEGGRTRWAAGVFVGIAAAAAIAFFVARRTAIDHVAGSNAQAVVYDDTGAMMLADGSRVRLRDSANVRVEHVGDRIELTLVRGTADGWAACLNSGTDRGT